MGEVRLAIHAYKATNVTVPTDLLGSRRVITPIWTSTAWLLNLPCQQIGRRSDVSPTITDDTAGPS